MRRSRRRKPYGSAPCAPIQELMAQVSPADRALGAETTLLVWPSSMPLPARVASLWRLHKLEEARDRARVASGTSAGTPASKSTPRLARRRVESRSDETAQATRFAKPPLSSPTWSPTAPGSHAQSRPQARQDLTIRLALLTNPHSRVSTIARLTSELYRKSTAFTLGGRKRAPG
jgi:hypothetical protein